MPKWILISIRETAREIQVAVCDDAGRMYGGAPSPVEQWRGRQVVAPTGWRDLLPSDGVTYLLVKGATSYSEWEEFVNGDRQHQPVRLAWFVEAGAQALRPMRLPLHVEVVGDAVQPWRAAILEHATFRQRSSIQFLSAGSAPGPDIVLCSGEALSQVLREYAGTKQVRPRLVISTSRDDRPFSVPAGVALYQLPGGSSQAEFESCLSAFYAITHNALEDALTRPGGRFHGDPRFFTHWKLDDAAVQLDGERGRLEALARTRELIGLGSLSGVADLIDAARGLVVSFDRELHGFLPLGRNIADVMRPVADLLSGLGQASRKDTERLVQEQQRRVDIAIRPSEAGGDFLHRGASLPQDAEVEAWVRIGQSFGQSLMSGEPPPIDPLLPVKKRGVTLDAVVYGLTSTVIGPARQQLHLPRTGPSEAIRFRLRTPAEAPPEFRVAFYYKNQMLQSFLVSNVENEGARARLEFSLTKRFTQVAQMGRRKLSLAVNSNGDGTHRIMVKGREPVEFALTEGTMQDAPKRYRDFLRNATFDEHQARRFDTYPTGAPTKEFYELMREAALMGRELYQRIEARLSKLRKELRAIRQSAGTVIQFVQFDMEYAFPWMVLYDWDVPEDESGPFCLGKDEQGNPCGHGPESGVFCLNGFWGIRHIMEQFFADGELRDRVQEWAVKNRKGSVVLSADESVDDLEQLQTSLGDSVSAVGEQDNVLDRLWSTSPEPGLVILFGHVEDVHGQRMKLAGANRFLSAQSLQDRARKMQRSLPLVLLLGCETAAIQLGGSHGFVDALQYADAAAIVGTESMAFGSLLARFGREVSEALWQGEQLGVAMSRFRRNLAAAGNPVPFTFQAFGRADFHLRFGEK